MKTIKLENRITYFLLTFSIFLLNFKYISLLSLLFGSLISLLFILLIDKLNLYKYNITKIILLIISIPIMIYYLNKISYFIGDNILKDYSIIAISITYLLTIFIIGNKGYHTIIKVILLSSYFIFFILLLSIIITIPYININNLNINYLNTNNLILNTIIYSISLIYTYFLIYPITNTKFLKKDLFISSIFHLIIYILIISILGILNNYLKYPYIIIFKKVNLLNFIERIEILFSLNYLFIFYYYLLFIFYQIKLILNIKIKNKKHLRLTLMFLCLFIFLISMIF